MASIVPLKSLILEAPPSCIEFSALFPDVFVVGTYVLEQTPGHSADATLENSTPQTRHGELVYFRLSGDNITEIHKADTNGAVLDLHFRPIKREEPKDRLCVATSTGVLELHDLAASGPQNDRPRKFRVASSDTLVLSLVWHPNRSDVVAVTLSTGQVRLCQLTYGPISEDIPDIIWQVDLITHGLEAWTVVFGVDGKCVFSGGDDGTLRCHSLPDEPDTTAYSASMDQDFLGGDECTRWVDRKAHTAGVTAILPLLRGVIITGSYDDKIRIVSSKQFRRQILAELNLGGGVWRLKYIEGSQSSGVAADHADMRVVVLASCMHAGARIVEIRKQRDDWSIDVLARFEEHQSMNYGSDIQPSKEDGERNIISTSFYDKLLCLWRWKDDSSKD
ncbi:hypothetical protein NA57DRAFT_73540 [Rhizodiscina lignyota]|uniref:methylated diphthine methylhydrolase n=1 Tax=Rhizodiscina lignyota TaxID=1504668 RepID=A0A9P4IJ73_9PEZI|nr:hypothetical protein NA57DRAFT_73540 [Rhizodiscina lignyota]